MAEQMAWLVKREGCRGSIFFGLSPPCPGPLRPVRASIKASGVFIVLQYANDFTGYGSRLPIWLPLSPVFSGSWRGGSAGRSTTGCE